MSSTFFGLTVAGSGLTAFQASINTTANNVSNVRTEGYSKQVTNISAASAMRAFEKYGNVGTGVSTDSVTRVRDQYYNEKYWVNQSQYGYYEKKNYYMAQIEQLFKDDSQVNPGFSTLFGQMFNSLDTVKTNNGNNSVRNQFVSNAQKLCTYFNSTSTQLKDLQTTLNDEIKTQVDFINSSANKIALLNKQINLIETGGGIANELRDEREKLLDKLSEIITVESEEIKITNSNYPDMYTGATRFTVKVNGQFLVDGNEAHSLQCKTRLNKYNQSDVEGLYDVVWAETGMNFSVWGNNQKGALRSLFEMRDGNDQQNLRGTANIGSDTITIDYPSITEVDKLNMPENGVITVNNVQMAYSGWEAELDKDGKVTRVRFTMKEAIPNIVRERGDGRLLTVGQTIACKGVPYYQNQMNEFVRALARKFNGIEKTGQDLHGETGTAFFVAVDRTSGDEYDFKYVADDPDKHQYAMDQNGNYLKPDGGIAYYRKSDGTYWGDSAFTTPGPAGYPDAYEIKDGSQTFATYYRKKPEGDLLDKEGGTVQYYLGNDGKYYTTAANPRTDSEHAVLATDLNLAGKYYTAGAEQERDCYFYGEAVKSQYNSSANIYYKLTADNVAIADAIVRDPQKFAATLDQTDTDVDMGIDASELVSDLLELEHNVKLFRGGGADEFLQCIYADITVDTQEAETFTSNFGSIQAAIQKQRESVSGVDEDEEAMNLVKFQNAYNLAAKVIQTLTEMYDQLILSTGV
jgi:flagellar hook-associated protein 1 FlgK